MKDNGGPAFPVTGDMFNGMSLRDYFAAKAMQSILMIAHDGGEFWAFKEHTAAAYQIADAMLAERAK